MFCRIAAEIGKRNSRLLYRQAVDSRITFFKFVDGWQAGKTVFANWVMVDPGQTATVYLKYKLPFKLSADSEDGLMDKVKSFMNPAQKQLLPYALLAQKQPGSLSSKIISTLKLAPDFRTVWQYPAVQGARADGWQIDGLLNIDRYWAVLVEADNYMD